MLLHIINKAELSTFHHISLEQIFIRLAAGNTGSLLNQNSIFLNMRYTLFMTIYWAEGTKVLFCNLISFLV